MTRFEVQEGSFNMGGELQWVDIGPIYKYQKSAYECITARKNQYIKEQYSLPRFRIKETQIEYYEVY